MTISTTDFPTWFFAGFYGGLVCCTLTIVISLRTMYTHKRRRRVIPRRLFVIVGISFASALCLLPTVFWFRAYFTTHVSLAEITVLVCCVLFFGWLLPIGTAVTIAIGSHSSALGGGEKLSGKLSGAQMSPPRYQSGVMAPFVFSAETPWGWLEYRSGNFMGQRLALKRSIITLGRAEDSDIWLDDDMASRRHAEVAWQDDVVYLTDCDSLNSTRLNGRRVRGSVLLSSEDTIEIGTQRFLLILAEQKTATADQYDPLVNHKWRSSFELQDSRETTQYNLTLPQTKPLLPGERSSVELPLQQVVPDIETSKLHTPPSLPAARGALFIANGELAGKRFSLQSLSILVGSSPNCDLVVPNFGLAPQHARFIRQAHGDYVQNISEQGNTLINGVPLYGTHLLLPGDQLHFGTLHLIYLAALQAAEGTVPPSQGPVPVNIPLSNKPIPLRLPSRPKES